MRAPAEIAELRRHLAAPRPRGAAGALLLTYAVWAAAWALALGTASAPAYVVAFLAVVAVQTRLAILMHEAAHNHLHPERRWNERLGNGLVAWPIGMSVETYRAHHLQHHRRLGTPEDRDFANLCVPPMQRGVAASLGGALTGGRHLQLLRKYLGGAASGNGPGEGARLGAILGPALWQLALLVLAVLAGQPWAWLLLWLLPLLTVSVFVNELRTLAEHTPRLAEIPAGGSARVEPVTRTVRAGWLARTWLAPLRFHLHHEHHLCPELPYSALPELHRALVAQGYYERNPELLSDGYLPVLKALWSRYRPSSSALRLEEEDGVFVARAR